MALSGHVTNAARANSLDPSVDVPISFTDSSDNTGNGIRITILAAASQSNGFATDFDFAPTATPIPGALPLFAGGLGLIGYLTGRRKRKNKNKQAVAAA